MSSKYILYTVVILLIVYIIYLDPIQSYGTKQKLFVGKTPLGIAYSPENDHVYVANFNSNTVTIVDGVTNTMIARILVGTNPTAVAYDSIHKFLYVTNSKSNTVYAINTDTNKVVSNNSISVGKVPYSIAYNAGNHNLYVANFESNSISIINSSSNKLITNITVGIHPTAIAYNSNNGYLYVANRDSNTVSVIDGYNNIVISEIKVGLEPLGIAVDPFTNMVYVANNATNKNSLNGLSEINATTRQVVKNITITHPEQVAINLKTSKIYVSSPTSDTVFVIDTNRTSHVPEAIKQSAIFEGSLCIIIIPIILSTLWLYRRR